MRQSRDSGIAPQTGADVVLIHDAEEFPVKVLRRRRVNKPPGSISLKADLMNPGSPGEALG